MKKIFGLAIVAIVLASCGQKVAYTDALKEEFDLTPQNMVKVQFFTSATIILDKSKTSGNQTTGNDGALVVNSSKTEDRVIIPTNTKCIFEKIGDNNEVIIRFEIGTGKTLKFATRPTQTNGKYYLVADWKSTGGSLIYGNETYTVQSGSSSAYLQVLLRKLQRTKRKNRVVKGMKI